MKREPDDGQGGRRPFIGIYFRCCQVYQRIYRHSRQERYTGRCPRCLREVVVEVGTGGTTQRIFEAE